ncbi:endonuclease-3 [Caldicoprobacter guelmensis]|uniref:endonuclease III n=1 Tax=Caldicoprobacter guelmensis TaxID=1170224 RepID=UPI00195A5726|nr:endonuclease III [Caldicoprobacter guelmensis]MBM7582137.1 endonuclease-3 [Caldicoprobacter guelmensis]
MTESERRKKILEELEKRYKGATTALKYKTPFQLLVATMLSAQSTDKQVNKVTAILFEKYPGPEDFARLSPEELEKEIYSCGFYKTKSRNIIKASQIIIDKYGGQVPQDLEELQTLPGVGRKTANVVVSNAFGVDAIAVDTHVFRVSNRLGLAHASNVKDTERQLMENIPRDKWSKAHHWLIWHGRKVCTARNPKCHECFLTDYCEYYNARRNCF